MLLHFPIIYRKQCLHLCFVQNLKLIFVVHPMPLVGFSASWIGWKDEIRKITFLIAMRDTLQVSSKQLQLAGKPTNSNEEVRTSTFSWRMFQESIFWIYNKSTYRRVCRRHLAGHAAAYRWKVVKSCFTTTFFFVAIHDELCRPIICFFFARKQSQAQNVLMWGFMCLVLPQ